MRSRFHNALRLSLLLNGVLLLAVCLWIPRLSQPASRESDSFISTLTGTQVKHRSRRPQASQAGSLDGDKESGASLEEYDTGAEMAAGDTGAAVHVESSLQAGSRESHNSTTAKPAVASRCALHALQQCQPRTPRPSVAMRGTRFWVMYNLVMGDRWFACDESVTYTTHGDFTFVENIGPLVNRWRGPISFGLYAPGDDFIVSMRSIAYLRQCGDPLIAELVTFHVIFDVDKVPFNITQVSRFLNETQKCKQAPPWKNVSSYRTAKRLTYPVNVARNVARETVMTHFVLPSDVELYPSESLVTDFMAMIRRNYPVLCGPHPRVYVLSIFEVSADMKPPMAKDQLTTMLKNGTAIPFHKHMCPICHTLPKAKEWTFSPQTSQLDVFHIGKRHKRYQKWEPIYICTNDEPGYDERLTWEGKMDKMGQGYAMCLLDYDFMILNNAFLVHKPGIKKFKPDKWRDTLVSKQRRFIINAARLELERIYGTRPDCSLK